MARGDLKIFDEFGLNVGSTRHDFPNDTLKLGIITTVAAPAATQAEPKWGTYSGNEVATNAAYSAGGPTIANSSWSQSSNVAKLDGDDVVISQNSSGSTAAAWGIIYNDTHSSDAAIGFVDLGAPVSQVDGDITVSWNASGILTITVTT